MTGQFAGSRAIRGTLVVHYKESASRLYVSAFVVILWDKLPVHFLILIHIKPTFVKDKVCEGGGRVRRVLIYVSDVLLEF